MNVLSVFDGISVAKLALDKLGISNTYISAEIDKYASYISDKNHPEILNLGNVTTIMAQDFAVNIDLLIGGSPCQGFSLQGLQKGLEDSRSGLVSEFIRLRNELKPKYFLLENTRMNKECKTYISNALGVEPIEINSLAFVPQSRNRLYWTNLPVEIPEYPPWVVELENGWRPGTTRKGDPRRVVFTPHYGCLTASYYKGIRADGRPLLTKKEGVFDELRAADQIKMLTPEECEGLQGLPKGYTEGISNTQRYKAIGNAFTLPVITHILKNMS